MSDLIPVEQKQVGFYDDTITAVRLANGRIFVPIRPICDTLTLDWSAQYRRLQRDPVLDEVTRAVAITTTARSDGRPQTVEMVALPIEYLNGWLFGISANRVNPQIRDRLIAYQRDCYRVLHEAMQDGRLSIDPNATGEIPSDALTDAQQAVVLAQAVLRIAQAQLRLEQEQAAQAAKLTGLAGRIEALETAVTAPSRVISADQAMQLSQAVKAVAMALSKQTRRNEYGGVYGELYRRFGITSYKQLPNGRFSEAMSWLAEWLGQVESESF